MLNDREVKAAILEFLIKKGRWGAHYFPTDTLVNWMGRKVEKDGKRVKACLKELANEGYLLLHKKGETASLNPAMIEKIQEMIKTQTS
ncbi:MAG: hypothetical protein NTX81_07310 [Candidatus Bathyarchaeota archaeon]|nr:hypothetical protein [Candidatus Bathyarchaeota archaeon]